MRDLPTTLKMVFAKQSTRFFSWPKRTRIFIGCLVWGIVLSFSASSLFAQQVLPYEYKARNLKPADFGFEGHTWEMLLRKMNNRMDEADNDLALLRERAIAYREYGVR